MITRSPEVSFKVSANSVNALNFRKDTFSGPDKLFLPTRPLIFQKEPGESSLNLLISSLSKCHVQVVINELTASH